MLITTFFTENGVPKTGLTPIINIWDKNGTLIIDSVSMTEIAGGFYKYEFESYNDDVDYIIRADGGESLPLNDRYVAGSNEIGAVKTDTEKVLKVEKNKWIMENNKLKIYNDNGTDILYEFDLKDKNNNPAMENVMKRIPV
jgi:hypothetical protein